MERRPMRRANQRSHRSRPLSLLLLVVLSALVAACGGDGGGGGLGGDPCKARLEAPTNLVVVLFDISGSTGTAAARARYREGFDTVLAAFADDGELHGEKSTVAVGAIDASTYISFKPLQCTFPEKGSGTNPLVHSAHVNKVQKRLNQQANKIIEGPRDETGTAILDAFAGVSRVFERQNADAKYLVMFSDMVEESERGRRLSKKDCEKLAGQTETRLEGVRGYVAGAGVSSKRISSERVEQVRGFWTCYFGALGGELSPANYGPTLLGFP